MAPAASTTKSEAFLSEWDAQHAYPAARQLEKAWFLPAGYCSLYFPEHHERWRAELDRVWAAMLLSAGDLRVCCALLKGERVPRPLLAQPLLAVHQARTR